MRYSHYLTVFLFFLLGLGCIQAAKLDTSALMGKVYKAIDLQAYDLDSSMIVAKEVLSISKQHQFRKGEAYAYMRIGSILDLKGKNDSAIHYIRQVLTIRESLKDNLGVSGALRMLGYIYMETNQVDSVFSSFLRAADLVEKEKDSVAIFNIYIELGHSYIDYGSIEQAGKYYNSAKAIAIKLKNTLSIAYTFAGLGKYYYTLNEFDSALYYYQNAALLYEEEGHKIDAARSYNNIAISYTGKKNYRIAILFHRKAIETYREMGLQENIALAHYNIGLMFNKREMPDSAIYYLKLSKAIADSLEDVYRQSVVYKILSHSYVLRKDYFQAYHHYLKHSKLKDSLLDQEKISAIAEMQTKYETEKKEQQIALLDEQNKTQKAERNYIIASSAVLLLLLLISGVYYYQRSRIAIKNEKIAQQEIESLIDEQDLKTYNAMLEGQEEERMRIATDLHDRLGSMLSTVKLLFSSLEEKFDKAQEENQQQYAKANHLLDDACVEIRRISHNLGTGMVANFGLKRAIEELCESVDQSGKIKCKALIYGIEKGIPLAIETGIYRMVQEGFNNAIKHAKADNLTVQLNKLEDGINVTIEDDGVGFDLEKERKAEGMGLSNLEKRAQKLGGELHIDTQKGRGTTIIIDLPLNLQA